MQIKLNDSVEVIKAGMHIAPVGAKGKAVGIELSPLKTTTWIYCQFENIGVFNKCIQQIMLKDEIKVI